MQKAHRGRATRALITGASLFALSITGVGTAFAGGFGVSDAQARAIAQRRVPGTVVEVDHEHRLVEVTIRDARGELQEVSIDPHSGYVTKVAQED